MMWVFWVWLVVTCIASGFCIHGEVTYGGVLTIGQVLSSIIYSCFWPLLTCIIVYYWIDENPKINLGKYWKKLMDRKIVKGKNS